MIHAASHHQITTIFHQTPMSIHQSASTIPLIDNCASASWAPIKRRPRRPRRPRRRPPLIRVLKLNGPVAGHFAQSPPVNIGRILESCRESGFWMPGPGPLRVERGRSMMIKKLLRSVGVCAAVGLLALNGTSALASPTVSSSISTQYMSKLTVVRDGKTTVSFGVAQSPQNSSTATPAGQPAGAIVHCNKAYYFSDSNGTYTIQHACGGSTGPWG